MAVSVTSTNYFPSKPDAEASRKSEQDESIQKKGFEALKELGFSWAVWGIATASCADYSGAREYFGMTLAQNLFNGNFKKISDLFWNRMGYKTKTEAIATPSNPIYHPFLSFLGTGYRSHLLIHELGHFYAAKAVYRYARPRMYHGHVEMGGFLYFLTDFGKKFGNLGSSAFVSAAGPLMQVATGSIELILSRLTRESHPNISSCLEFNSYMNFVDNGIYAFSTYFNKEMSGDFNNMQKCIGLHPLAAGAVNMAIPFIVNKAMDVIESQFCKKTKEPAPSLVARTMDYLESSLYGQKTPPLRNSLGATTSSKTATYSNLSCV